MSNRAIFGLLAFMANSSAGLVAEYHAHSALAKSCMQYGGTSNVQVTGNERELLWKRPRRKWKRGAGLISCMAMVRVIYGLSLITMRY